MAQCSVVSWSAAMRRGRIDAEYFMPRLLDLEAHLDERGAVPLGTLGEITCSAFYPAAADLYESGDMPFLRCVDVVPYPVLTPKQPFALIPEKFVTANSSVRCLEPGDIVITKVGTPCYASLLDESMPRVAMSRTVLGLRNINAALVDSRYLTMFLRSSVGFDQLMRERELTIQYQLTLERTRDVRIVLPPMAKQRAIGNKLTSHIQNERRAIALIAEAETLLSGALGLSKTTTDPALYFTRTFSNLRSARRFDAEYFSPRYQDVMQILSKRGQSIHDVAALAERRFRPEKLKSGDTFQYIEIGSVRSDGLADSETVEVLDAPSRAQWIVEPGDVITSTVRPLRRLSALIKPEQSGNVCSSGFAVLRPKEKVIEPEVLLTFLRLPIVCEILDLHTTASMNPAISTTRLMEIPIAVPTQAVRKEIVHKVRAALKAHADAARLLAEAKAEVERFVLGGSK